MSDEDAKKLLDLLKVYFQEYPDDNSSEMTCKVLMDDLEGSLED